MCIRDSGIVDLKTRAQIERLYWSVTREISQIASGLKHAPDEFRKLDKLCLLYTSM